MVKLPILVILSLLLFTLNGSGSYAWTELGRIYATEINISANNYNVVYRENSTPITRWINFTGLSVIPYNESFRITAGSCSLSGATEVRSAVLPFQQNASGHVFYARLVIIPNVTASGTATYCVYYNYTKTPIQTYSTDLIVKTVNVTNSYMTYKFTNGAVADAHYLKSSDNGNDASGGNSIGGLHRTGANILTTATGQCLILYNFSIAAVVQCYNSDTNIYHYFFSNAPMDQMNIQTPYFGNVSLYEYGRPNGSTGAYNLIMWNATYSTAQSNASLPEGKCATYCAGCTVARAFVWNATKNQSTSVNGAGSFAGCQPIGANLGTYTDFYGNKSFMTMAYITGANDTYIKHNLSNMWALYVGNQNEPVVGAVQTIPPPLPIPPLPPITVYQQYLYLFFLGAVISGVIWLKIKQ